MFRISLKNNKLSKHSKRLKGRNQIPIKKGTEKWKGKLLKQEKMLNKEIQHNNQQQKVEMDLQLQHLHQKVEILLQQKVKILLQQKMEMLLQQKMMKVVKKHLVIRLSLQKVLMMPKITRKLLISNYKANLNCMLTK